MAESSHARGMVTAIQSRVNGRPRTVKYFQVYLEDSDDEEPTLFVDSWIYLDTESADEKEKSQPVHKNQYTVDLNVARKSDDETKVNQVESFPEASTSHTSQILPHASSLEERQVAQNNFPSVASPPHTPQTLHHASSSGERQVTLVKSPPVASPPHTPQTLCHASSSGERQVTQIKSPQVASSPHTPQTLRHASSSGERQVTQVKSPSVASSPHTPQTLRHASSSGERQVTLVKSPPVASSPHTPQTLHHAFSSGERQVTQVKSPPAASSPHTPHTLRHASSSGERQVTLVKSPPVVSSPHTSQTLPHASSSGEEQVECHSSHYVVLNFLDSDALGNLNIHSPLGEYGLQKEYVTEASPINISSEALNCPMGFCSKTEISRHSTDSKDCSEMEDAGETRNTNASRLFSSKTDVPVYPTATSRHSEVSSLILEDTPETSHTNDFISFLSKVEHSSVDSARTSRQSTDMHSLEVENITKTPCTNVILPEAGEFHKNSIETSSHSGIQISTSRKSRKRRLSEDEIAVISSENEYSDNDSDIICIKPCNYLKPINVCESENHASGKKVTHKCQKKDCTDQVVATNDIAIIYENIVTAKHNTPPIRIQTMKGTWASSSDCKLEIIID